MRSVGDRGCGVLFGGLAALLAAGVSAATEYPGTIPGGFSVSDQGAGQYTIPIAAPAATGGLKPSLALTYNHLAGDGLAGMRWTLSGFSSITRCGRTWAQDVADDSISYDSGDRYCLDGQRLVVTSGSYGDSGSLYSTEIESFQRITSYGSAGSGPQYFTVEHGNGSISWYGYTTDSRIEYVGESDVRVWYLSYTEDQFGNRITYGYEENGSTGEAYPDEVLWTSNSGQGLSARYQVEIVYESRPSDEQRFGYDPGGAMWARTKRIDKVRLWYNTSSEIATYDMAYSTSGVSGRSQLDTVTLSRGSDTLPETIFTWQDGAVGWASAISTGKAAGTDHLIGDFNNDGRDDVFVALSGTWQVYRGRTDGDLESAIDSGISSASASFVRVLDYDGDGKTDLIYPASGAWYVATSTGTGFASPASTGVAIASVPSFLPLDFDGDGLDDMVYQIGTQVKWRRNTGGSFDSAADIVDPGMPLVSIPHWPFPDLNGDGRDMLFFGQSDQICDGYPPFCWYEGDYAAYELAAGATAAFGAAEMTIMPPYAFSWPLGIDVNGDGLDDLLHIVNDTWYIALNNGVTFDFANAVESGIGYGGWNARVADYDNDGREDLLVPGANNWYVYRSDGTTLPSSATATVSSSGAGTYGYLADINGDGLEDILQRNTSGNWNVHLHNGGLPDVVTTFENGLGAEVDVTYESLAQTDESYYYVHPTTVNPTGPYAQKFSGPRYVVTEESHSDGIGGTHDYSHYYETAHVDRSGRGWLSFFAHLVKDLDQGTHTLTYFRQDWPYAGALYSTYLSRTSDSQFIRESYPSYGITTNTTPTPDVHFIRTETMTSKEYEVGGTDDGDLIRTVVDNPTYNTTYGFVEERTVTTTDPTNSYTWTTVTDYNPSADTDDWCLGLPGQVVTTNTKPDSSYATRSISHTWNGGDCSLAYTIDDSDSNTAKQLKTSFTYDGYGNPNVVSTDSYDTSAQNRSVDYDFDSWGQFVTSETVGAVSLATTRTWDYVNAQPATVTGADGLQVSYSYDSFGRLASENTPGIDTAFSYVAYTSWPDSVYYVLASGSDGSLSYEFFDSLNRSVGRQWRLLSDWALQITEYNTLGQVSRASRPYMDEETVYWVDYTHDLLGRVIEEDAPVSESSPSGAITTTQYLGESVWVTDAENHTTKTEMNAVGQIVKVTDANSNYATYTYKPFGELATMTDAESNTTTVSYDPRGFKNGMSDPNMGDWDYEYNLYGELASQTNALDQTTTLLYDEAGRLYQRSEAEGTTTWSYYTSGTGAKGKLSSISAPGSYAEYVWYDTTTGQPSQHQRVISSVTYQYNMTYDGYGRLDTLTYPTSTSGYRFKVDYDFDGYGHLQSVKDGNETYTYWTLNSTDALGRPTDVDLGNGRSETWDFDKASGHLENITTDGSVQNLSMTYDEVGNVLTRQDSLISKTETFTFDAVNRMTASQVSGQSSISIAYSAAGRITSKTGLGSYSYGAGSAGPFAVTSANSIDYTYDANGRMITRGSGEIDWTSYDLPSKIDDLSDSSYTEFWYGPDRSRIQQYQSSTGATITYAGLLFEFEDAATDAYRHYVQAGDKVIAVVERVSTTNTKQFLHRDHQGSVTKVTNASGTVDQALAFDAWGLRRNAADWSALGSPFAGAHETERGYTGHEHLDSVGLIHMNGRVQDPILGRFISADPLIQSPYSTQSHNRYSYVWNNPASMTDPSGFWCVSFFGLFSFGGTCPGGSSRPDSLDEGTIAHTGISQEEWDAMQSVFDEMDAEHDRYIDELVSAGSAAASAGAGLYAGRLPIVDTPPTAVSPPEAAQPSTTELFIYTIRHHWKDILRYGVQGAREYPTGELWVEVSGVAPAIEGVISTIEGDVESVVVAAAGIFVGRAKIAASVIEMHHLLPQAERFRKFFERAGLDIDQFKIPLERGRHRLNPNGIHTTTGGDWNGVWDDFFEANPGATRDQILRQLETMRRNFGI